MTISDRQALRNLGGADFLSASRDLFQGRVAIVVSCGPSASGWYSLVEEYKRYNPLVVCVKQSFDLVGSLCDIHFLNAYNVKRYGYTRPRPFVVFGRSQDYAPAFVFADLIYCVCKDSNNSRLDTSLAGIGDFSRASLSSTGLDNRPWGPGIMLEIVLPALVHFGVGEIATIGWDIASDNGSNAHYYDSVSETAIKQMSAEALRSRSHLWRWFSRPAVVFSNSYNHLRGRTYNPACALPGEASCVSRALPLLRNWLAEAGVVLKVHSRSKWHCLE